MVYPLESVLGLFWPETSSPLMAPVKMVGHQCHVKYNTSHSSSNNHNQSKLVAAQTNPIRTCSRELTVKLRREDKALSSIRNSSKQLTSLGHILAIIVSK